MAYSIIMSPEYVRRRLRAICNDASEVHGTPLFEVNVWAAQDCGFGLCKREHTLKIIFHGFKCTASSLVLEICAKKSVMDFLEHFAKCHSRS